MGDEMSSFFITAGDIKRLKDEAHVISSHLKSIKQDEMANKIIQANEFLNTSVMYIGIPHETYPSKITGSDLKLGELSALTPIRIETKIESINDTIKSVTSIIGHLDDMNDKVMAGHARKILEILEKILKETYHGKTHQVPTFDAMAQRLTY
jgi:hypothetical protein